MRAQRLRGVPRRAETGRAVPILHVEHKHEGRARRLFRVALRWTRRGHDRKGVPTARYWCDPEECSRLAVIGRQRMDEIRRVNPPPLPLVHVVAHLFLEFRKAFLEARQ